MASTSKTRRRRLKQQQLQRRNEPLLQMMTRDSIGIREGTFDDESRTVDATLASEASTLVAVEDHRGRKRAVEEVLLMSGIALPEQVPLLDSHDMTTVQKVLGSIRNFRIHSDISVKAGEPRIRGLDGQVSFTKQPEGESAFQKYKEGHLRDVSIGYLPVERKVLRRGQVLEIEGRTFTGPKIIVTKWKLKEGSVLPMGADSRTRLRNEPSILEDLTMDETLLATLESRGMPKGLEGQEAIDWLTSNRENLLVPEKTSTPPVVPDGIEKRALDEEAIMRIFTTALTAQEERREEFRLEVRDIAAVAGVEVREEWNGLKDVTEVRKAVIEARQEFTQNADPIFGDIRFSDSQPVDRGVDGIRHALLTRSLANCTMDGDLIERKLAECPWGGDAVQAAERASHQMRAADAAKDYRHFTLMDLASRCLMIDGFNLRGAPRDRIAYAALGFIEQSGLQLRSGYGAALHTTGSFANLTLDAINKSMQTGAEEFPATWEGPMRRGTSVQNFKTIHRLRAGAIPNLKVWVDGTQPDQAKFTDADEPYAVEAYSVDVAFSYRTLIDDDMDELSRTPQQMGLAASRTVNAVAWSKVTGNANMSDLQPLFLASPTGLRKRGNLLTGAGVPTVITLQDLGVLMEQMRGENTPEGIEADDILGIRPVYLIGPSALRTTIMQLVNSVADPAAPHGNVSNPGQSYIPIIEPLLDTDSATAWYLFAAPQQVSTVEVTFLEGQDTPAIIQWTEPSTLSRIYKVLQTFAAKALNHRGVAKHAGA